MKDQHTKIKGYRDLTQQEIDLMNKIKEHGEQTKFLLDQVKAMRQDQQSPFCDPKPLSDDQFEQSFRCLGLAADHLQTGQMWFVRAVALPDSF